jgi:2-methylcitrate dehydratase PrpD
LALDGRQWFAMAEIALLREACEWAAGLKLTDIPADVRDLARAQLLSMAAAVHASMRHPVGGRLLGTPVAAGTSGAAGWPGDAARHALLTMALDFDETAFAGHLGHASVMPALIVGTETGAGGAEVMVAQVAAAEVAARVTAAVTLGSARGQTATHTHAAAAVVGCGLLLGLSSERLAAALSLALAQPRRVMLPAFMATDAKFWVAAAPILDAARCIEMARSGALGLDGLMEAPGGLLEQLAAVPLPEVMSGWGSRWHLRTLSIKAIPGCAYLTSAVEAAASLAPIDAGEVESVELAASVFTLGMEVESSPYIKGPQSPLPALGFSVGYSLAAALETGGLDVDDLHGEHSWPRRRWEPRSASPGSAPGHGCSHEGRRRRLPTPSSPPPLTGILNIPTSGLAPASGCVCVTAGCSRPSATPRGAAARSRWQRDWRSPRRSIERRLALAPTPTSRRRAASSR